jgi:hypothetical protein
MEVKLSRVVLILGIFLVILFPNQVFTIGSDTTTTLYALKPPPCKHPVMDHEEAIEICKAKYPGMDAQSFMENIRCIDELTRCQDNIRTSSTSSKTTTTLISCDDYCKAASFENADHAIGEGDYSTGCGCVCEKGWTFEERGCVSCADFCGGKGPYVYDPDLSYTNFCECVVEGPSTTTTTTSTITTTIPAKPKKTKGSTIKPYVDSIDYCGKEDHPQWIKPRGGLFSDADFNFQCYEHDNCFGQCIKLQSTCDLEFYNNMLNNCDRLYNQDLKYCDSKKWLITGNWLMRGVCKSQAYSANKYCRFWAYTFSTLGRRGGWTGSYNCP